VIPAGVQIFVAVARVDMRYGFERLAGLVRAPLGYDARSGALFVFVGKRGATLKALFFDGTGMCLLHKKLDRGVFALPDAPAPEATHVEVDAATLDALLDGLALAPGGVPRPPRPRRLH
jgi:transposase